MSFRRSLVSVRVALASLALLVPTSDAVCQRPDSLPVGARVRVDTRITTPRRMFGILEAADSTAIAVVPDGRPVVLIRRSDVRSIAVGRREPRPGGAARGAKRGFQIGAGITIATMGVASAIAAAVGYKPGAYEPPVSVTVAIFGVPFTVLSTVVGAVVGTTDRTVWRQVWPR